jgi:predicted HNH restriction endonuclease
MFAWAIKGKDADTKEVVEAIGVGVLSFAESQEIHAIEGGRKLVTHLKVERSSGVSREAVRRHVHDFGTVCALCTLDFRSKYQLAAGEHCLEAHHKVPLATRTEATRTNLEDFLVICPSCHRVVHKVRAFDDEALGRLLRKSA